MEVAKTRLQLDGELQGRAHIKLAPAVAGSGAAAAGIPEVHASVKAGPSGKVYTSALDCMQKTWKFEGLRGIQRGLGAAVSLVSLPSFASLFPLTLLRFHSTHIRSPSTARG
jgi:solute carrier family 25 protein 34/35